MFYIFHITQVYGETTFELVDYIIREVKLGEDDVFVDLGSGKLILWPLSPPSSWHMLYPVNIVVFCYSQSLWLHIVLFVPSTSCYC